MVVDFSIWNCSSAVATYRGWPLGYRAICRANVTWPTMFGSPRCDSTVASVWRCSCSSSVLSSAGWRSMSPTSRNVAEKLGRVVSTVTRTLNGPAVATLTRAFSALSESASCWRVSDFVPRMSIDAVSDDATALFVSDGSVPMRRLTRAFTASPRFFFGRRATRSPDWSVDRWARASMFAGEGSKVSPAATTA